jgi:hypothetical protein
MIHDSVEFKITDPAYEALMEIWKRKDNDYMNMNQVFEENGLKFRYLTQDTARFYIIDNRKYILFKIKYSL